MGFDPPARCPRRTLVEGVVQGEYEVVAGLESVGQDGSAGAGLAEYGGDDHGAAGSCRTTYAVITLATLAMGTGRVAAPARAPWLAVPVTGPAPVPGVPEAGAAGPGEENASSTATTRPARQATATSTATIPLSRR